MKVNRFAAMMSFLIIILLVTGLSPVKSSGYLLDEQRITDEPSIYYTISMFAMPQFPSYDNGIVVWKDDRNENADIYMHNFMTETVTPVTIDVNDQGWPSISGDVIVWMDDRNGNWDIYMYDISDDVETQVTTDTADQLQPCIYGDIIVWHDVRGLDTDIYMYDIGTSTESVLIDASGDQYSPWVSGDIVVWEDNRGAVSQIYYYDFSDPVEDGSILSSTSTDQYWPTVNEEKIVWTEDRDEGTSYDVFLYDLAQAAETQITSEPGLEAFGYASGNLVVWTDSRSGTSWDVYMYDMVRELEVALVTGDFDQGVARIYGNLVIWGDSRNAEGLEPEEPEIEPCTPTRTTDDELFLQNQTYYADIYAGNIAFDDTPPTFDDLPDKDKPIDIDDGQTISTKPVTVTVKPIDSQGRITTVQVLVNNGLVCTDTEPDENGQYGCNWDPSLACSARNATLTVLATDTSGNVGQLTRNVILSDTICPGLADTGETNIAPLAAIAVIMISIGSAALAFGNRDKLLK